MADRTREIVEEVKLLCEKLAIPVPEIVFVEHTYELPSGRSVSRSVVFLREEKRDGEWRTLPEPELRISPEAASEMDWSELRYRIGRALLGGGKRHLFRRTIISLATAMGAGAVDDCRARVACRAEIALERDPSTSDGRASNVSLFDSQAVVAVVDASS